jgi:hypothetical protein
MALLEGTAGRCRLGVVVAGAILLGPGNLGPVAWACGANLQPKGPVEQVFELRFEGGEVAHDLRTLRVMQGDRVRLRWTADVPTILHLHGYDIEKEVAPGQVTEFDFEAYGTGRFTIEVHAEGDASHHAHDEAPLVVLEVYPR